MSESLVLPAESLGACLLQGMQLQVDRYLRYRRAVLRDRDPEDLHQLRVSLRRLRSLIEHYGFALILPKSVSVRLLAKLGQHCGTVRDFDVLLDYWRSLEPPRDPYEHQAFRTIQRQLQKQTDRARRRLQKELKRSRYQTCLRSLRHWLAAPQFQPCAYLATQELLPELLLPRFSPLHLHAGWWVVAHDLKHLLPADNRQLHDLRKAVKRFRYGLEVLETERSLGFEPLLQSLKPLQTALGDWQDRTMWTVLLQTHAGNWQRHLPSVVDRWQQESQAAWQRWLRLQQSLRDPETGLQALVYDCLGWRSPQAGRSKLTPS